MRRLLTGVGSAEGLSSQTLTLGGLGVGGDRRGTDGCDREPARWFDHILCFAPFQMKRFDFAASRSEKKLLCGRCFCHILCFVPVQNKQLDCAACDTQKITFTLVHPKHWQHVPPKSVAKSLSQARCSSRRARLTNMSPRAAVARALPYLTLPYFTLPYLTLPCLTLPYLT